MGTTSNRGYGFITPEDGGADFLFLKKALVDVSPDDIRARARVEFRVEWDEREGKERAVDVRLVSGGGQS